MIVRTQQSPGSAPRARGTLRTDVHDMRVWRISPACAGNTSLRLPLRGCRTDQPRVRGEHASPSTSATSSSGSAPRARGTRVARRSGNVTERISPACAGNTHRVRRSPSLAPDQPRVRGEHRTTSTRRTGCRGSAPRARGTPAPGELHGRQGRISPACAGNTPVAWATARSMADQPRVRGEH